MIPVCVCVVVEGVCGKSVCLCGRCVCGGEGECSCKRTVFDVRSIIT